MSIEVTIETTPIEVEVTTPGPQGVAGVGVPAGGTTGQVLGKASGDDYDTEWVDQTGGGGGAPTDVQYLVLTADGTLTDERVLALGTGLSSTDGGAGGSYTLSVDASELDHDTLSGFVANEHVDHSSVSVVSGVGITGGGDLTSNRTLNLDISTLAADTAVGSSDIIAIHDGAMKRVTRAQLESSIQITESQITDLGSYLTDITSENLGSLADVTQSAIGAGEVLGYTGLGWSNRTLSEAGIAAASHTHIEADITDLQAYLTSITGESIGDLNDVSTAGAVDNDLLQFSSGTLLARSLSEAGIASTSHASTHADGGSDELDVADLSSGAASSGHVPTADGAGGVAWAAQTGSGGGAPNDAQYVLLATNPSLSDERVLVAGTGLAAVDAGAGGNVTLSTDDSAIDHDALSNFVADEHVDHSSVSITAGVGLAGGGTIEATRTINLDTSLLSAETSLTGTDTFPFHDGVSDKKITWSNIVASIDPAEIGAAEASHDHTASAIVSGTFADARVAASSITQHEAAIDHNALTNYVASQHTDHSSVSVFAGIGLSGGGTIDNNITLNLATDALTAVTSLTSTNTFPLHDGVSEKKITWANIVGSISPIEIGAAEASHNHTASAITAGTFADARIAESNVTQHNAAINIAWSQVVAGVPDFLLDITGENIEDLSNVTITSVASGEVLTYTGSGWENRTLAEAGIASDTHVHAGEDITSGQVADARIAMRPDLGIGFDGGGSALTTGVEFYTVVMRDGVITGWDMVLDQSGSATITVDRYTPSGGSIGSPTSLGSMSVSSAQHNSATGLSWSVSAGDIIRFELTSASTAKQASARLKLEETT